MLSRCCEFVDSRLRRSPPDRASAVPYGQAGENAMRFPHLAHRSAAAHKLHSTPQQHGMILFRGMIKPAAGYRPLAILPRKLSKQPGPSQDLSYLTHIMSMSALAQQLRLQDQAGKGQMRSRL